MDRPPQPRLSSAHPLSRARWGCVYFGGRRVPCVIESLGVYLPSGSATIRDVLAGCDRLPTAQRLAATRMEKITGIRSVRVASGDETAFGLARRAMSRCLATSRRGPRDIDLVVCASISRYESPDRIVYEPSLSLLLADYFGCERALAFDVSSACAGMFTGIRIVEALVAARVIRVGMVVSGEHITDLTRTAQKEVTSVSDPRFACLTLGDAAAAVILEEQAGAGAGFGAIDLYTSGEHSDYCIAAPTREAHGGVIMRTDSANLLRVGAMQSAADVARALAALGWGREDLDHFIMHQTSLVAIDSAERVNRLVGTEVLDAGNVINNLAERGNTATTTHLVATWDGIMCGRIRTGDRALFAIQGSGLTTGIAAYTFDDLPDRIRAAPVNGYASLPAAWSRRSRTVLRAGDPRIRIESCAVAEDGAGPRAGMNLARQAIDRCLRASAYAADEIDLLIFAGVHRDGFVGEPAVAARLAGLAGFNPAGRSAANGRKTLAFDVFNGAMGFLDACLVAAGMIRSGATATAMVVASEVENNAALPHADRSGIAETGSAVILDRSPGGRGGFGHAVFGASTGQADALTSWLDPGQGRARMRFRRAADLDSRWLRPIADAVEALLEIEGLAMHEIDLFLPPQISREFAPRLAQA